MSVNKSGGGNKTNINGLKFEQETSLNEALLCLKGGLMSIFWTQKVKLFYAALLANNSHCSGVM